MGYKSAYRVRMSGLDDGTLVDVLEAIACFVNEANPAAGCYPSLETVMRLARKSKPSTRGAIKSLCEMGLLSFEQRSGDKRTYYLNLDALPEAGEKLNPVGTLTGSKTLPGEEIDPVKFLPEGGKKVYQEGVKNFTPKRELNRVEEKGIHDGHASSPERIPCEDAPPLDHFDVPVTDEKPGVELKPKKPKADRGSRMTIENLPEDWRAFVESEDADLDPDRLFQNFRDYWLGVSGSKGCKCDWFATWRNNVRSFKNAPDWKRRPMLKPEAANRPQYQTKFVECEKRQEDRVYGI